MASPVAESLKCHPPNTEKSVLFLTFKSCGVSVASRWEGSRPRPAYYLARPSPFCFLSHTALLLFSLSFPRSRSSRPVCGQLTLAEFSPLAASRSLSPPDVLAVPVHTPHTLLLLLFVLSSLARTSRVLLTDTHTLYLSKIKSQNNGRCHSPLLLLQPFWAPTKGCA